MRSRSLAGHALVVALGVAALTGCGTQQVTTGASGATGATGKTATTATCTSEARETDGDVPRPEDLPGYESAPPPRYGPGETPPGVPDAHGDIPIELDDPAPSGSASKGAGSAGAEPDETASPVEAGICDGSEPTP
ncbi:hypothetical protein [Streptomyces sp. NPDC001536]|uniref:hypothetical protein n=1 Tax=Streptomyces sp. NPDC001536 TaxID=3364583 RepID=UPI003682BC04